MDHNNSPWIAELNADRKSYTPALQPHYDVAIIGGGISGMVTAYYTLKNTKHSVVLLEGGRIGQGATGHNAGQVVDYFEKPFSEIVEEYGLPMAIQGQKAITSAWKLLEEILAETKIDIPFPRFTGYAGCTTLPQLLLHLGNKHHKTLGGLQVEKSLVAQEHIKPADIPQIYREYCTFVPQAEILTLLETSSKKYIALLQSPKGTMNSALFVEKLAEYLLEKYKERLTIREHALVNKVNLFNDSVSLETQQIKIETHYVVLCTNGFEDITLINHTGMDINHMFHKNIAGIIGYMVGYLEKSMRPPKAISYFPPTDRPSAEDPYFYVTRRRYRHEGVDKSLICTGGPEETHEEVTSISINFSYSQKVLEEFKKFFQETYPEVISERIEYLFKWHGLMGYTKTGIRSIGQEPANPRLLYNLGCNGVGLLPSIFGGKKIAAHLAGEELEFTIFDPLIQKTALMKKI